MSVYNDISHAMVDVLVNTYRENTSEVLQSEYRMSTEAEALIYYIQNVLLVRILDCRWKIHILFWTPDSTPWRKNADNWQNEFAYQNFPNEEISLYLTRQNRIYRFKMAAQSNPGISAEELKPYLLNSSFVIIFIIISTF